MTNPEGYHFGRECSPEEMEEAVREVNVVAEENRKDAALTHVNALYMANATKDTNPGKSFPDVSKSVHDLISDANVIVDYLKGDFDLDD